MARQQTAHVATVEDPAEVAQRSTWRPISRAKIDATVRQIVAQFRPQQVILFGSYAYGQPRPDSDVDLLVVLETSRRDAEQAAAICQAIEYHFPLDLIVRTPAILDRRLALGDPFLADVVKQGEVLYERPDA